MPDFTSLHFALLNSYFVFSSFHHLFVILFFCKTCEMPSQLGVRGGNGVHPTRWTAKPTNPPCGLFHTYTKICWNPYKRNFLYCNCLDLSEALKKAFLFRSAKLLWSNKVCVGMFKVRVFPTPVTWCDWMKTVHIAVLESQRL